jgi:cytochrome c553
MHALVVDEKKFRVPREGGSRVRLGGIAVAWLALALGAAATFARADSDDALGNSEVAPVRRDLEGGRRAYERCAVCHGADGSGRADGTFPRIAGQHRSVVVAQLNAIRDRTRPNPIMAPHARALLDEEQVLQVATYVAGLAFTGEPGLGSGDDLERGERLYRSDCADCHGEGGKGNADRLVPALAGQHYSYLLRRARDLGSWQEVRHPWDGRPLEEYTDAELRAVVDFAGRLPGGPQPEGR